MRSISILENTDTVRSTDLCRPLNIDATGSSCDVEGYPKNHAKWAPVRLAIPAYFHDLKVESLLAEGYNFEFARGEVPDNHKLDTRLYPAASPVHNKPVTKWATANIYTIKAKQCLM